MKFNIKKIGVAFIAVALILSFFVFRFYTATQDRQHQLVSFRAQQHQQIDSPSAADTVFLQTIRKILVAGKMEGDDIRALKRSFENSSLPQAPNGFALVLYQPGKGRLVVSRHGDAVVAQIKRVIKRVIKNKRFNQFAINDPAQCRIQFDFILKKPQEVNLNDLTLNADSTRFEMGVDGLLAIHNKKETLFLPGDAFVRSLFGLDDLKKYMARSSKQAQSAETKYFRFRTESYVSYQDKLIKLYRGYPIVGAINQDSLKSMGQAGVNYVTAHQKADGSFLYYYDAATDSFRDHEHPKRNLRTNAYYNILRHVGGILLILYDYDISKNQQLLPHAKQGIDFLLRKLVTYQLPDGSPAAYVFDERKAKLGGSGIALYMFSFYQHLTGDRQYEPQARALANHLLTQIQETGEFIYYYRYLDEFVKPQDNKKYFNFYYPGEAMIGLATYYKYVVKEKSEQQVLIAKMKSAFDFLVKERPKLYGQFYTTLPADSWLMMAIEEAWAIPQLQDATYSDFVFGDAGTMVRLMYKPTDALYPDYVGSFYYKYGDTPYPDGARCEGLLAAYQLAIKLKDKEKIAVYEEATWMAAWATAHLVNTPESMYAAPNPALAVGGIRFKMTRQWFRVDTIEHVAAFYLKFFNSLKK